MKNLSIDTTSADDNLHPNDRFNTPQDTLKVLEDTLEKFKLFAETGDIELVKETRVKFELILKRFDVIESQCKLSSLCGLCDNIATHSGFTFSMNSGLCKACYDELASGVLA